MLRLFVLAVGMNHGESEKRRFISSSGRFFVSGMKAQKKIALVKLHTTNVMKYRHPTCVMAGEVICPISVLKAKLTMTPMETPFDLVLVSKTSAGMIQDRLPQVNEKDTW